MADLSTRKAVINHGLAGLGLLHMVVYFIDAVGHQRSRRFSPLPLPDDRGM
jgi:hypothetical protein